MKDNIIQVDVREESKRNMARYSLYILYNRYVPDARDGLKPVQRRILTAMFYDIKCVSLATKRKSANTVGMVMGKYHAHGDCLRANTPIYLADHTIATIGELYNSGITTFASLGVNPYTLKVEAIIVHDLRIGQYTNKIYHIELSNGAKIECTGNHPLMMYNGAYLKAEELYAGALLYTNTLQPLQDANKIIFRNIDNLYLNGIGASYYTYANNYSDNITEEEFNNYLKEYLRVRPMITNIYTTNTNNEPMYDFTVDTTNNMLIPVIGKDNVENQEIPMICVHNSSIYGAMQPLANWWECMAPLLTYDSASGTIQGGKQAAMRYTESCISQFGMDCAISELVETKQVVNWQKTFDNHNDEPETLPVKVPLLLINGAFSIAIGRRIEVPPHSMNDVIDATLTLMHNPNAKIVLIPDQCMKCEIINTDWKKISNMGFGNYVVRGIITQGEDKKGKYLSIRSTPDIVFSNSIVEKIEELIKDNKLIQVADINDHSTDSDLDIRIYLKNGADPNYVKQVLYKNTSLQDTKRVNMEVLDGLDIKRFSYKAYLLYFLEYRRGIKFRLYNYRLQKVETRLHQIETYIKVLESGDVENIVHMIRNQASVDENYLVNWLMKKLKITDIQALFILRTQLKALSKGNLDKYKAEQKDLLAKVNEYVAYITDEKLIDKEIENELLEMKAKYGKPRQSVIISEAEASNIPEGEFKIAITESNFVKKMQVNEPIKAYKGDNAKYILIADNSKDILLFDQMGKVFRLQVHKIPFTEKNSAGVDIRLLIKKLTSNIISVMYVPILEMLANKKSKYYLSIISAKGLIKRIDLNDIINATPSGIIYTKLNKGDSVKDIIVVNHKSDIVVYTKSKALRMPVESTPYLKRSTLGNMAMKTTEDIDGMSVVTRETTDIVVVTNKGKFNRFGVAGLPVSDRNKAGGKVIKLAKGDYIHNIFSCNSNYVLRVIRTDEVLEINVADIPIGSSVSAGTKMCKDGILKVELIRGSTMC